MPATELRLFRDDDDSIPLLEWLTLLESRSRKAYLKCRTYLDRLARFGGELRRPAADYLRDGVYELRVRHSGINYRMLYGYIGQNIALVSHGITKEKTVPDKEIDLAVQRLALCKRNPAKFCWVEET